MARPICRTPAATATRAVDPSPDTRLFLDALSAAYVWTFPPARPAPSPPLIAVGPVCETSPLLAALDTAAAATVLLCPAGPDAAVAAVAFQRTAPRSHPPPKWPDSFLTAF